MIDNPFPCDISAFFDNIILGGGDENYAQQNDCAGAADPRAWTDGLYGDD